MKRRTWIRAARCFLIASLGAASLSANDLPTPDESAADLTQPVQVFLIMGQSNTLEMGRVGPADKPGTLGHAVQKEGLYDFLTDDQGEWVARKDVRNVSVMSGRKGVYRNDWLTVSGRKIGIEIGIGHKLGEAIDAPVMVLKSSIGNRSLGWDLLPPGSERFEFTDPKKGKVFVYPGYKDSVRHSRWLKGEIPAEPKHGWYAGKQYDSDVQNAKMILENLETYYPGAKSYEVTGILWWQGDKDMRDPGHASRYEANLVSLLQALRKEFDAPEAAFVCASLGQTKEDDTTSGHGQILQSMKAFASGKYREELGEQIGFVYTHPLSQGSSSSAHYGGNARTYMDVGLAMGEKMVEILKR